MQPGDVFAMNDPYRGGIHANDIMVFRPVFADGRVRVLRRHAHPRRRRRRRRGRRPGRAGHRHVRRGPAAARRPPVPRRASRRTTCSASSSATAARPTRRSATSTRSSPASTSSPAASRSCSSATAPARSPSSRRSDLDGSERRMRDELRRLPRGHVPRERSPSTATASSPTARSRSSSRSTLDDGGDRPRLHRHVAPGAAARSTRRSRRRCPACLRRALLRRPERSR